MIQKPSVLSCLSLLLTAAFIPFPISVRLSMLFSCPTTSSPPLSSRFPVLPLIILSFSSSLSSQNMKWFGDAEFRIRERNSGRWWEWFLCLFKLDLFVFYSIYLSLPSWYLESWYSKAFVFNKEASKVNFVFYHTVWESMQSLPYSLKRHLG